MGLTVKSTRNLIACLIAHAVTVSANWITVHVTASSGSLHMQLLDLCSSAHVFYVNSCELFLKNRPNMSDRPWEKSTFFHIAVVFLHRVPLL